MAIYAERTLKVKETNMVMDRDIILYRGNRNVYIFFSIENLSFGFKNLITGYESFYPSHAYITLLTPMFSEVSIGKTTIDNDRIQMCISERMIDELTEVGDYTIVIDLYDEYDDSLLTLPPIENQLKVRDRITSLTDTMRQINEQSINNVKNILDDKVDE